MCGVSVTVIKPVENQDRPGCSLGHYHTSVRPRPKPMQAVRSNQHIEVLKRVDMDKQAIHSPRQNRGMKGSSNNTACTLRMRAAPAKWALAPWRSSRRTYYMWRMSYN